ncbi:3-hydroxyacyl-ACP dehydratase FabZ family protein [Flavobacterium subsaxonicum]|uniref:3-hydroxydecanoyl-ACP dehydratase n=1 Tax=Flavobacterium subsaxonicum WB 4.1-42 = DSM 21790 TaxID=1121898 RepID=A0A0A2MF26_9FLAO|nr:3-hydroxydecanoyl-ACP dehydratase [Flavobacterium subsaxonicum]KGO90899.1 3-hydroxydecanoyl-ACP dehydratase [Flavobacterium subsaxonicum WB 4.1-42 = DSM 21790]
MAKNIEELIPHRAPFLFVDEITHVSMEEIVAVKTFETCETMLKDSFTDCCSVPGTILIESIAQAGGAGIRLLGITDGIFALVQIESAQFFAGVPFNQEVKYVIKNIRMSEKIIKQSGKAYVGDNEVMEVTWMSIKIGERHTT